MKKTLFILLCCLGAIVSAQNEFETTLPGAYSTANAVSGWTVESGQNPIPAYGCGGSVLWSPGSSEFSIVATPVANVPILGNFNINNVFIPNSPLGGNNVARIQDAAASGKITRIKSNYNITSANSLLKIAYCGSWEQVGHLCCDKPNLLFKMFDCLGTPLNCYTLNLTPAYGGCPGGDPGNLTSNVSWTNWVTVTLNLSPLIGNCVRIEISNSDCNAGSHNGTAYVDLDFSNSFTGLPGNSAVPGANAVNFCPGATVASLNAPLGFATYSWVAPTGYPISPAQSSLSAITITNPVLGNVYSVTMVLPTGCIFYSTYTLQSSQVNISAVNASSSCSLGVTGSASVVALGSASGYSYTWINSNNNAIGSGSVVSNLSPGTYSVQVSALGAAACGSAVSTVTIGVSPPNYYSLVKSYCGAQVLLTPPSSGSNYQWYNNTSSITAVQGGTAPTYTVTSPINGAYYRLRYTTSQGCIDSVRFVLNQISSGAISVTSGSACIGSSNASASVVISQNNVLAGQGSFSVFSVPAGYSATLNPAPNFSFVPSGMSPGSYSVIASDGACSYTTGFTVNAFLFNYTVSPTTASVCSGNNALAAISFSTPILPGQYSFSWTPSVFLTSTNNISTLISPTVALNTVTNVVYTITVVPAILNCPLIKTITITAANAQQPIITPIQPFCTNSTVKTVTVSPTGGTFTSVGFINANTGIIYPAVCSLGTNTFVYTSTLSGCTASASASFTVSLFNTAALTTSLLNICSSNCINLNNLVLSAPNGIWSGPGIISGTFCPILPFSPTTLTYNTTSYPNPFLCPDSRTLMVSYSNPIPPSIFPVPSHCTTDPPFQLTTSPLSGSFTPNAYTTVNGLFTPSLCTAGIYTVQYNSCNLQASQQVSVEAFVPSTLTGSLAALCSNNAPVSLSSIPQNSGGTWMGSGVSGTQFSPGIAGPGNFVLTYNTSSSPSNLCPSQSTLAVTVYNMPTITILGNAAICIGQTSTLTASGASTYTWNQNPANAVLIITPNLTTTYSLSGTNTVTGCSNTQNISVTVNALPTLTISGNLILCKGAITTLTATGANTYSWSNNISTPTVMISATVSSSYTVTGININGCSNTQTVTVSVKPCTGIEELNGQNELFKVYPNPTNGNLFFELESQAKIILYDELGQTVLALDLKEGKQSIDLGNFEVGIYLLTVIQTHKTSAIKVIRTN